MSVLYYFFHINAALGLHSNHSIENNLPNASILKVDSSLNNRKLY